MKLSTLKRRFNIYLVNHLFAGTPYFEKKRKLLNAIGHEIGEGTKIVGPIYCSGTMKIGRDCWIGRNFTVNGNGFLTIGDRCDIAPDVSVLSGGHDIGNSERRAGEGRVYSISVGDGVWIGARATLGKNIVVGSGSVIAACACVMDSVKENTLVGGVPAKIIKELDE